MGASYATETDGRQLGLLYVPQWNGWDQLAPFFPDFHHCGKTVPKRQWRIRARVGRTTRSKRPQAVLRPTFHDSEVHVRQYRFNSADFLKLGVSNAFVIDETNRNLR
jgi:hypothetical protein